MIIRKTEGYTVYATHNITDFSSSVLALGNFDGVHIAHRQLLLETVSLKAVLHATYAGAWCFSAKPAELFKNAPPERLSSLEGKVALMLECGLDYVVVADFAAYMNMDATHFADKLLRSDFNTVGVCCGYNFGFGKGRGGDPELLKRLYGQSSVRVLDPISLDGVIVSSSQIRAYISSGEPHLAARMLGRNFSITSTVLGGKRLGRNIGFPTANQLFPADCVIPKFGIYATLVRTHDGKCHFGVSNVGTRPTITDGTDAHDVNCETYIIDFSGDLYGQDLTIEFCAFLRPELKFASVEELRSAIRQDAKNAKKYLSAHT